MATDIFNNAFGLSDFWWYIILGVTGLFFIGILICCIVCVRRAKRKGRQEALEALNRPGLPIRAPVNDYQAYNTSHVSLRTQQKPATAHPVQLPATRVQRYNSAPIDESNVHTTIPSRTSSHPIQPPDLVPHSSYSNAKSSSVDSTSTTELRERIDALRRRSLGQSNQSGKNSVGDCVVIDQTQGVIIPPAAPKTESINPLDLIPESPSSRSQVSEGQFSDADEIRISDLDMDNTHLSTASLEF